MHEHQGLDFEKLYLHRLGPVIAHLSHLNIDDGHASHDNWRLYATR
jgi:hypothetical protein